jgi:hypothetical protein
MRFGANLWATGTGSDFAHNERNGRGGFWGGEQRINTCAEGLFELATAPCVWIKRSRFAIPTNYGTLLETPHSSPKLLRDALYFI